LDFDELDSSIAIEAAVVEAMNEIYPIGDSMEESSQGQLIPEAVFLTERRHGTYLLSSLVCAVLS
jgi:hypothetical protein